MCKSENKFQPSSSQERLYFLHFYENEKNITNHVHKMILLKNNINIEIVKSAIYTIIERHEILRTNFLNINEAYIHNQDRAKDFILNYVSCKKDDLEDKIKQVLSKQCDLSSDFLFSVHLYNITKLENYFLLDMHNIISDSYSTNIFIKEFLILYEAYNNNEKNPLSSLSFQYSDYVTWQRDSISEDAIKDTLLYWKNELKGASVLDLPTTYTRPIVQSHKGNTIAFEIDANTTEKLIKINKQYNTTLFVSLLSAFSVLLHRYTQQDEIIIGSTVINRNSSDTKNLIGKFSNNLVFRQEYNNPLNFVQLLQQVRNQTINAYKYQDLAFEKILDSLKLIRDTSRSPLFQVRFILDNNEEFDLELQKLGAKIIEVKNTTSKFDLTLYVKEANNKLYASIEYATDLFSKIYIESMINNFNTLLLSITNDVFKKISTYQLLSEKEKNEQLNKYNQATKKYSTNKTIHQLFEDQVEKLPEKIAVTYNDNKLTYKDLNKRANQLAHYLISEGVKADELIGICIERSLEMIIGLLAILKAGGAYVPIDPHYPKDRIKYMLEDSRVRIVLTQESLKELLIEAKSKKIYIDIFNGADYKTTNTLVSTKANNLAYVIYTSGSTGRPKGVMIEHGNIERLFKSTEKIFLFNTNDIWTCFHSIAFDFTVWEVWGALLSGAKLIIVPYLISRSPIDFHTLIMKEKVTILNQTPSAFKQLIDIMNEREYTNLSLRIIVFGGEKLDFHMLSSWYSKYKQDNDFPKLINMYGITETTVHTTYYVISKNDLERENSLIGRSLSDLSCFVLDKNNNLVPKGVSGELHISGPGLARGYLNQSKLTKDRFITNPFIQDTTMYKTGDLVRYLEDGNLEYLGRIDDQVKIRGFRIELGEIEEQLVAIDSIQESVVLAIDYLDSNKILVGFIVTNKDINYKTIKFKLSQYLPDYMLPNAIKVIDSMPLTPNGKIDKKALENLNIIIESSTEYMPPQNELEKKLSIIFFEVLKIKKIGVNDNFFDIGGNSILAVILIAKINELFNTSLSLAILFQASTIKKLTFIIKNDNYTQSILIPIQTKGNKTPIFALPGAGGSTLVYKALSKALGNSQPFYGLDSIGPSTDISPFTGFEDIAKANILAMKTIQPVGPYRLIGFCLGGTMAYEMARLLTKEIDSVILLGAYSPTKKKSILQLLKIGARSLIYKVKVELKVLNSITTSNFVKYLINKYSKVSVGRYNMVSYDWYKPKVINEKVNISLFYTKGENYNDYGWNELIGFKYTLNSIEGVHISILSDENVKSLSMTIYEYYESINRMQSL